MNDPTTTPSLGDALAEFEQDKVSRPGLAKANRADSTREGGEPMLGVDVPAAGTVAAPPKPRQRTEEGVRAERQASGTLAVLASYLRDGLENSDLYRLAGVSRYDVSKGGQQPEPTGIVEELRSLARQLQGLRGIERDGRDPGDLGADLDVLAGRVEHGVGYLKRLLEQDVPAALEAVEAQT